MAGSATIANCYLYKIMKKENEKKIKEKERKKELTTRTPKNYTQTEHINIEPSSRKITSAKQKSHATRNTCNAKNKNIRSPHYHYQRRRETHSLIRKENTYHQSSNLYLQNFCEETN